MSDDVLLCKLVKSYPALYDPSRSFHRNRNVKNRIWEAIAHKLSAAATDCKQRWKDIKLRYARHYKMKRFRNPSPKGYVLAFYLAPRFKFLDNVTSLQKTKTNTIKKTKMTATDNEIYSQYCKLRPIQSSEQLSMIKSPKKAVNSIKLDDSFLDSVTDMKGMTPGQNKRFKVGIRHLIARVVEERYAKNGSSAAGTSLAK